jgi:hypothetical protein
MNPFPLTQICLAGLLGITAFLITHLVTRKASSSRPGALVVQFPDGRREAISAEGSPEDVNARIMELVGKTAARADGFKPNPQKSGTPRELA